MANKRQRLARKRFSASAGEEEEEEEEEEALSAQQPPNKKPKHGNDDTSKHQPLSSSSSSHSSHRKKKASGSVGGEKRMKGARETEAQEREGGDAKPRKTNRKHPLRVAGNKPGEGCFFCKSPHHVARLCPKKNELNKGKICLLCRERGHSLKDCPNNEKHQEGKLCYNCGGRGHTLASCPQTLKDGGTSFAECFLCKQQGHISRNCPINPHGIYPKGGACKICGEVTHLAKDCPNKASRQMHSASSKHPKLQISASTPSASISRENAKHIIFRSGDDLDDDFENVYDESMLPDADFEGINTNEGRVDEKHKHTSNSLRQKLVKTAKKLPYSMNSSSTQKQMQKHSPKVVEFKI